LGRGWGLGAATDVGTLGRSPGIDFFQSSADKRIPAASPTINAALIAAATKTVAKLSEDSATNSPIAAPRRMPIKTPISVAFNFE
jgi:hypothetical protein